MWGRDPRGTSATCSALSWLSVTSSATHKQIGPFWCWFLDGWIFVHSRTLWTSPMNSPVRMGVSSTASTPTGFFLVRSFGLYFPMLETWVGWSVSLPSCFSWFIHTQMWEWLVCQLLPHLLRSSRLCLAAHPLCPSCPFPHLLPIWINVFFNSLVVRFPYSSYFWQFWLFFFVFKFVVVLILVVRGGTVYLPMLPSWLEVLTSGL